MHHAHNLVQKELIHIRNLRFNDFAYSGKGFVRNFAIKMHTSDAYGSSRIQDAYKNPSSSKFNDLLHENLKKYLFFCILRLTTVRDF